MIIASKIDTVLMIDRESPGSHFRRKRAVKLLRLSGIRVNSEEKKGSVELSEGNVDGISLACPSGAHVGTPGNGLSYGDSEIAESAGDIRLEDKDLNNKGREKRSEEKRFH